MAETKTAVKATKKCECGCGGATQAHFVPGHDSRHKSKLFSLATSGNAQQREKALKEIKERNWTDMYKKSLAAKDSKFKSPDSNGKAKKKAPKKVTASVTTSESAAEGDEEEEEEEENQVPA